MAARIWESQIHCGGFEIIYYEGQYKERRLVQFCIAKLARQPKVQSFEYDVETLTGRRQKQECMSLSSSSELPVANPLHWTLFCRCCQSEDICTNQINRLWRSLVV